MLFGIGHDQTVRWLQRTDRMDGLQSLELFDAVIGNTNFADLALAFEFDECPPAFFDIFVRLRPVHLIKVDTVDAKSLEARVALSDDTFAFEHFVDRFRIAHYAAAFGSHDRAPRGTELFECLADQFLGLATAIDGCGVDPIDAQVDCGDDRIDRFAGILIAPAEFPITSADGPGTETDSAEFKVGLAELSIMHGVILS